MAVAAGFLFVLAFQRKSRGRVVEIHVIPAFHGMATLTFPFRNEFIRHLVLVNVFMTRYTTPVKTGKSPLFSFFVAGEARRCSMCSFQLKIGLVVLFDGEKCFLKTSFVVAVFTIRSRIFLCELPLVVILMAVGTTLVLYGCGVVGFVAFFAIQFLMFAYKSKVGFVVVEVAFIFQRQKRSFGMAFCAVLTKFVFMNVFVAIGAGAESNSGETLKIFVILLFKRVTFNTGYIGVFASQGEFGVLMIELLRRLK